MEGKKKKKGQGDTVRKRNEIDPTLQAFLQNSKGDKSIEFICSYLCFCMLY